jgi:glycosyltransferase involved in cell wall biosynthesis
MTRIPVFIAGRGYLSGVSTWAEQLRKHLADHSQYELQLLHLGPGAYEHADVAVEDVEAAHRHIVNSAPAIVIPNYVWELCLTGFSPGVRCIGMCHADSEEQYYHPLNWYESLISQFIAVSPEIRDNLSQKFASRANDVALLPYGIPVAPTLSRDYRTDPIRLIYAGRVTQLQKRVWDFIPLVEGLLNANVDFVFDVVGDGDQRQPLEEVMRSRFPQGRVRFHGLLPHAQMAALWREHDVFIQTSDFEGTSVSMLEAMAGGVVPVVTAASSGVAGVIEPGVNGFVAPVGDMAGLAQAIARLAADQSLLTSAGAAAHQTAQAYSIENYAPRFVEVLDRAMQNGSPADLPERYGMFAGVHPLLSQQRRIAELQHRLEQPNRGLFRKLRFRKRSQTRPVKSLASNSVQSIVPIASTVPSASPESLETDATPMIAFDYAERPGLASIVIPTYRGERFIRSALNSISDQTYQNWELIVVEDGHDGGSQPIVDDFAARHPDHRVTYCRNDRNRGAAYSRNVAFSKAAGEFIALLDCDDRWTSDHLDRSVQALQSTCKDLVYSTVMFVADQTEMPLGTWGPTQQDLYDFPQSLLGRNYITPSATVLRRRVIADVGLWNTEMLYCEDYEYWLRCIAAGKQFHWIGGCQCFYRKNHAGATTQKLCGTLEEVADVTKQFIGRTSIPKKASKRLASKAYAKAAEYHAKSDPASDPSADFAHAAKLYLHAWRLRRSHFDYPIAAAKIALKSLFRRQSQMAATTAKASPSLSRKLQTMQKAA